MKLGMEVGLVRGHTVLDRDAAPPIGAQLPQFLSHVRCGKMASAGWIKMSLAMEIGLSPGDFSGKAPNFRPMFIVAKQLGGSRRHFVRR